MRADASLTAIVHGYATEAEAYRTMKSCWVAQLELWPSFEEPYHEVRQAIIDTKFLTYVERK